MLTLVLTLGLFSFASSADMTDGFTWAEADDGNTVKITGYSGTSAEVAIPDTIGGLAVAAIGESAFEGNTSITKLTVPSSVKHIEKAAFKGCSELSEISFAEGLTEIGESCFEDCVKLSAINLPDSLKTLGKWAFKGCSAVKSLDLGEGVESIGEGALELLVNLKSFKLPASIKTVGVWAFADNAALESVDMSESKAEKIGYRAFIDCTALSSIILPSTLRELGYGAFEGCTALSEIKISGHGIGIVGDDAFGGITPEILGTSHPVCGTSCTCSSSHTAVEFTAWTDSTALPTTGGCYVLLTDVTLPDTYKGWSGNITLCLNGYTVKTSLGRVMEIAEGSTLTVTDCSETQSGKITGGNISDVGGGIYNQGTFVLYGGSITGNKATKRGGGICNEGELNIYGGKISGNISDSNGGGIYNDGELNIYGGVISGNTSNIYGGGIYSFGKLYSDGGKITDNIAKYEGGGIYISDNSEEGLIEAVFSGDVTVKDNMQVNDTAQSENNVYVSPSSQVKLKDLGEGSFGIGFCFEGDDEGILIRESSNIDPVFHDFGTRHIFEKDENTLQLHLKEYVYNTSELYIKVKGTDGEPNEYYISCSCGDVLNDTFFAYVHPICTSVCTHNEAHAPLSFTAWEFDNALPTESGNYMLTKDIELSDTWKGWSGDIVICLGGYSITTKMGRVIEITEGSSLTVCDCSTDGGGKITGGLISDSGGAIYNCGTLELWSGIITGNSTSVNWENVDEDGGAVYNAETGLFNMYGGSIRGNTSYRNGGGVANAGIFNLYGGDISNNYAVLGGGIYSTGILNLLGGSVINNDSSSYGGGVYIADDTAEGAIELTLSGDITVKGNLKGETFTNNIYAVANVAIKLTDLGEGSLGIGFSFDDEHGGALIRESENIAPVFSDDEYHHPYAPDENSLVMHEILYIRDTSDEYLKAEGTGGDPSEFYYLCSCGTKLEDSYFLYLHPICGMSCEHTSAHDTVAFESWDKEFFLPSYSGAYMLERDIKLIDTWKGWTGDFVICLNGYSITTYEGRVIEIPEGSSLTICDCSASGNGKIYGGSISDMGGCIINEGTLVMYSGTLADNEAVYGGAVMNIGSFTMYGGSISKNYAESGGGVYNAGSFEFLGGTISENGACVGGGIYNEGNITIAAEVTNNMSEDSQGGGVFHFYDDLISLSPTLTLTSDAYVYGNIDAFYYENNIYVASPICGIDVGTLSENALVGISTPSDFSGILVNGGALYKDSFLSDDSFLKLVVSDDDLVAEYMSGIAIDEINFPDPAFRAYILDVINTPDGDGEGEGNEVLTAEECRDVDYIGLSDKGVKSLKGIECFTMLERLYCSWNELSELDLSSNIRLTDLSCSGNLLTSLIVPSSIEYLSANGNLLESLDVSHCTALTSISCTNNKLESIKFSSSVEELQISGNKLESIDLSMATNLYYLDIGNNRLTELDLSAQRNLISLYADNNRLCYIDMTGVGTDSYYGSFATLSADNNYTRVSFEGGSFDLSVFPEGFDVLRVRSWTNATLSGTTVTVTNPSLSVSYEYYVGDSDEGEVYITFLLTDKAPQIEGFDFRIDDSEFFTPVAGESTYRDEAEFADAFAQGEEFYAYDFYWCDVTNGSEETGRILCDLDEEGFIFKGDTVYQLCIDVTTNGYFIFTEENISQYKVNGQSPDEWYFYSDTEVCLCYNMPKTGSYELLQIPPVNLSDSEGVLYAPEAGTVAFRNERLIEELLSGTNLELAVYYWGDGSLEHADDFYSSVHVGNYYEFGSFPIFLENSTYSLILILDAEAGYEFSDDFTLMLNSRAADIIEIDRVTDRVTAGWIFETGAIPVIDETEKYISSFELSYSEDDFASPLSKALLSRDISVLLAMFDGKPFSVYKASWGYVDESGYNMFDLDDSESRFLENTLYYLDLYIIADPGYKFSVSGDGESFTLNGKLPSGREPAFGNYIYDADTYGLYEDSTVLVVHYAFDITGEHTCSFELEGFDAVHHFTECICGLVLEGSREEHRGGNATCTDKAICSECTQPYGSTLAHDYAVTGSNSEGHTEKCSLCGGEKNTAHSFAENNKCTVCEYEKPEDGDITDGDGGDGISTGALVAIILGSVALLGGTGSALWFFVIKKKM